MPASFVDNSNPVLSVKSLRVLRTKSTEQIIPINSIFSVQFVENGTMLVSHSSFASPLRSRHFGFFFKEPSVRTLEKWSQDGVAKSVTGHRVEPDGYGPDGSPSWLLALGLI